MISTFPPTHPLRRHAAAQRPLPPAGCRTKSFRSLKRTGCVARHLQMAVAVVMPTVGGER